MLNHARASRWSYTRLASRRVSVVILAGATSVVTACHDATPSIMAPARPAFDVSGDGTWQVNSLADPGDGVCTNSECTLREAIAAAQDGDVVTFKSNLSGTINLTAGQLLIDKVLTIEGPGAAKLAVNGQNLSRVFQIGTSSVAVLVTLSGLTVTGGYALPENGGGISVWTDSRLALIASFVSLNTALNGGGIHNRGRLNLVRSTVAANRATVNGGGVYSFNALTVNRSTVSGNRADLLGGGIFTVCAFPPCEGVALRSTTITNNDAGEFGGGFRIGDDATLWNTIIAGNRVDGSLTDLNADCYGMAVSLGYNLSTLNTGCDELTEPTDVLIPLPSLVFVSVLELLLADNGGTTKTHALIERGYAVDAGYCPGETVDQRAFPRPYDDLRMANALDGCDIGAFEWQPLDTKIKGPKP